MAIESPTKDDLKRLAEQNHFALSDSEADAINAALTPIIAFLDRIDQTPGEPSPSVTRYRDRDAGRRPTPEEDPLNAVVRKIKVKGAASGKLKGKRIAVKDSVAIAGIPIRAVPTSSMASCLPMTPRSLAGCSMRAPKSSPRS